VSRDVEAVKEALKNVRLALARTAPLFFFQLSSLRITYVPKYSYLCTRCGGLVVSDALHDAIDCDKCGGEALHLGGVFVNKDGLWLWKDWNFEPNFLGVIKHELLHWMLQHPFRGAQKVMELEARGIKRGDANILFNLAADVKVNQMLADAGERLTRAFSPWDVGLSSEDVRKMSVEEILEHLIQKDPRGTGAGDTARVTGAGKDVVFSKVPAKEGKEGEKQEGEGEGGGQQGGEEEEGGAECEGTVIQDWKKELKEARALGEEKFAEAVQRSVIEDVLRARMISAGTAHGSLLLQIQSEVIKPEELAWWIKLYNTVKSELMKTVVQDWTRVSRRFGEELPGLRIIRKPRVYCCVDVSGSVYGREEVYRKFIGVMLQIARMTEVYAVFWDTAHSNPIRVINEDDLRCKVGMEKISGGGGTMVTCLRDIFEREAKAGDFVVLLTDGYFYENYHDVKAMVDKCKAFTVLCWSDKDWECFKVRIKVEVRR
jgi:predicted metal-dependent peptidase